jgi:hypothetical protein
VRLFWKIDNLLSGKVIRELLSTTANRAGVLLNNYFLFDWEFRLYRWELK